MTTQLGALRGGVTDGAQLDAQGSREDLPHDAPAVVRLDALGVAGSDPCVEGGEDLLRPRPVCLARARARREGRPWGCVVHVAEGVL